MGRVFAFFASFAAPIAVLVAAPAQAGEPVRTVTLVEEWVEVVEAGGSERFVSGIPLEPVAGIATYGPFRVIDGTRAALVGITDRRSPAEFAAMLRDYPTLATLDLVECPGTFDDKANLELGRMIRRAGIATHVPRGGSVRSGAVELFIAGAQRSIDDGAQFAVHAWIDDSGREATDYAIASPENRKYLAFYREMGMTPEKAEAFYAMTNSVPFEDARWLSAADMRGWVRTEQPVAQIAPQLAYLALDLDLGPALN